MFYNFFGCGCKKCQNSCDNHNYGNGHYYYEDGGCQGNYEDKGNYKPSCSCNNGYGDYGNKPSYNCNNGYGDYGNKPSYNCNNGCGDYGNKPSYNCNSGCGDYGNKPSYNCDNDRKPDCCKCCIFHRW